MKNVVLLVIGLLLIGVIISGVFLIPKLFPKEAEIITVTSYASSKLDISTSSVKLKTYTLKEYVDLCHSVISGRVIKADVTDDGVLYKINIIKVYKGRNYTSLGTVFISGSPCMEIGSDYLIFANVGDGRYEKYEYSEPIQNAPWIFIIGEDNALSHSSNGNAQIISDINNMNLENIKNYCTEKKS